MHKIRHIELEITNNSAMGAGNWEEELCQLGTPDFWSFLEIAFDRFSTDETIVQIDSLSLELHLDHAYNWKQGLQKSIIQDIEIFLSKQQSDASGSVFMENDFQEQYNYEDKPLRGNETVDDSTFQRREKNGNARILPSSKREMEIFLHYLVHGVLPWDADPAKFSDSFLENEFPAVFRQYTDLWKLFLKQHKNLTEAISLRLAAQCPKKLFEVIVQSLVPEMSISILTADASWTKQIRSTPDILQLPLSAELHFRKLVLVEILQGWPAMAGNQLAYTVAEKWLQAIVTGSLKELPQFEKLLQAFKNISSDYDEFFTPALIKMIDRIYKDKLTLNAFTDSINDAQSDRKKLLTTDVLSDAQIFSVEYEVAHAGMVLLYPYVQHFFMDLNLLEPDKKFRDEFSRQQAVYWWHYLACGTTELPEYSCVLGKILCGMSVQEVLAYQPAWKYEDLNEAGKLLKALIGHWEALKNCSVEALREAFLMRRGRLLKAENNWILRVESSSVDILMNRLPFTLSQIYLPWLEIHIQIEWL